MKIIFFISLLILSFPLLAKYENVDLYGDHVSHLHHATVQNHQLAYIDEGKGTPIVLIHGIPTSSWMYRKIIPGLVQKGYRVIAPDLLGMGASERVHDESLLTIKNEANIIHDLLVNHLKLKNWIHVVHDVGGLISWEMAQLENFEIQELIVLDTFAFEEGWKPELTPYAKFILDSVTTGIFEKDFYRAFIWMMLGSPEKFTLEELNHLLDGYIMPLMNGASETHRALFKSARNSESELPRYQRTLRKLSHKKTKIIWGGKDNFWANSIQMYQFIDILNTPKEDVHIIKNGNHLILEDAGQEVLQHILNP